MTHTLMHKDLEVAEVTLDASGMITYIGKVISKNHLPVDIVHDGFMERSRLSRWWKQRCIPASRSGIRNLLDQLDICCPSVLLSRSLGLSLSDQYWIRPSETDLDWHDVNFFENPFSDDVGDLLFGNTLTKGEIDLSSPDNTSEGNLKKRWKIIDGERILLKSGNDPHRFEVFNEVIASSLMDRLGIVHTKYDLLWIGDGPCCSCKDFITPSTDLVTAYHIQRMQKRPNNRSVYDHYVKCCSDIDIDIIPSLDRMIVVDYLMLNHDRHMNNFGLIRDVKTLEWLGPAPIFDTGSSLGHDRITSMMSSSLYAVPKPFAKSFDESLDLVSSFDWMNLDSLEGFPDEIDTFLADTHGYIDDLRRKTTVNLLSDRIRSLKNHLRS